ncbi:uncharacterized protein LOC126902302 [Daktulosphaira vitifoliae]|uniref:uncharacterized protein LOC126902302 n=1 Tax=Daktulosphaira vitifoliae TaxID=58002 RepID=UPI0021AAF29B|nr:uncharacterized protein LOC126902302 [Daktulosphaira vitifoliae]
MEMITKLKRMLLSQDTDIQEKCIRFIIHVLRDSTQFDYISTMFLDDDLIQFLCEPLLSIKTPLLQNLCLCLWMLSKNEKFYERNDLLYTCENLMRTLIFLIKTSNPVVTDLIQLLAILIKKGGPKLRENCNMTQVFTIIKLIFVNSGKLSDRCTTNAVFILNTILSCPSVELNDKLYTTAISVSKAICKIFKEKDVIDPYIVGIASDISSSILRFYSTIIKRIEINSNLSQHRDIVEPLKNVALYLIEKISLPFIQNNINSNIYCKTYLKGLKCLLSPFNESILPHVLYNVANEYATRGMISVLYGLLEYSDLHKVAEKLLFNVLYHLSIVNLEVECYWPGGLKLFYTNLKTGIKNIPKTSKEICMSLVINQNSDINQIITIYLYFYFLTCSNVECESIYLEPLCVYLCSINNYTSIPHLKSLLFNVSISFVSHHAVNTVSGLSSATKKMIELLNSLENIDTVFTFHPAILYFLFASNIFTTDIQLRLMRLWVKNLDDTSQIELQKLCLNNDNSKMCLLDVLINEKELEVVNIENGFNIINFIILEERQYNKEDTILIVWDILPNCLGSFCCAEESLKIGPNNLLCLLNLAKEFIPHEKNNLTFNAQRNTTFTILSVINCFKNNKAEHNKLTSLCLQHLIDLITLSPTDVLNIVKNHDEFLSILINMCLTENNEHCYLSLEILIKLHQSNEPPKLSSLPHSVTLKYNHILTAMDKLCYNCIISSITLFELIIKKNDENYNGFINLEDIQNTDCLKAIFFKLETIVISIELDWVKNHAWKCMKTILSSIKLKKYELQEIQCDLAFDPWLYYSLRHLNCYSEVCLEFLQFWFSNFVLNKEREKHIIHGKFILCTSIFDKTIVEISSKLINQTYENKDILNKAIGIIHLIIATVIYMNK